MDPSFVTEPKEITVIIPFRNELGNLGELHTALVRAIELENWTAQFCYVDDHSTDEGSDVLVRIAQGDERVTMVSPLKFGKTAALHAGFAAATANVLVTIDGDLQNDPADISALVKRVGLGADMVCGRRTSRTESFFSSRLPSMVGNLIMRVFFPIDVSDYGCGLKVFRRASLRSFPNEQGMHRFLPVYALLAGAFRIEEVPVSNRPRKRGRSKNRFARNWECAVGFVRTYIRYLMVSRFCKSREPLL